MNILPQIAQITQRNAAGCIISQRKTGWVGCEIHSFIVVFVVIVVLGFCLRKSAGYICNYNGLFVSFFVILY